MLRVRGNPAHYRNVADELRWWRSAAWMNRLQNPCASGSPANWAPPHRNAPLWRAGSPRAPYRCSPRSAAVAQGSGDSADRELNGLLNAFVSLASTMALEQLNLQMIQGLDVGQSQPDRNIQLGIVLEQARLARNVEQAVVCGMPGAFDLIEVMACHLLILHQRQIASGDRQIALGQHHLH